MNNVTQIKTPFEVVWSDYPDDESVAIILYFLGCEHNCYNCHNEMFQLKVFNNIFDYTINSLYISLLNRCKEYRTRKIVLSGGDPLHPTNEKFVKKFVSTYKDEFDFCIYTGYSVEEVQQKGIQGFTFLKTGQYKEELKQESIKTNEYFQLASSNQEIYDSNYELLSNMGRMYFK